MKALFLAPLLIAISSVALADPTCHAPKDKWMPQADFKKGVEAQGYQIKTFKVTNQCYEIYGKDKTGKKVEVTFDPVTAAILETR